MCSKPHQHECTELLKRRRSRKSKLRMLGSLLSLSFLSRIRCLFSLGSESHERPSHVGRIVNCCCCWLFSFAYRKIFTQYRYQMMNRTVAAIAVIILISIVIKCGSTTRTDVKPLELELEGEIRALKFGGVWSGGDFFLYSSTFFWEFCGE